jgi:hypothetical protein
MYMQLCGKPRMQMSFTKTTLSSNLHGFFMTTVIAAWLLILGGCRQLTNPEQSRSDKLVRRYLVLVLQLGERDPDSVDYYVAADSSLDRFRVDPPDLKSLHASAITLGIDLANVPINPSLNTRRKQFLLDQVGALTFRIEQLMGTTRPFNEESRALFGVVAPRDAGAVGRSEARKEIADLLGRAGDPAAAYSRYDARFIIPQERVPAVMDAALRDCRTLTLLHIALPPDEQVRVEYVSHKPWSAFSRYLGDSKSLIQVNVDYPLTVSRILNLACHEGYPGHHVFNLLRDQALVRDLHRDEFRVQPTFSPQSYLSEAAATYAPTLLWSDDERLAVERDLLSVAGLKSDDVKRYIRVEALIAGLRTAEPSIARDYLDGKLEFVRAADALERETLMQHTETTLLYLNEFRTYMLTYTVGADQVRAYIEQGNASSAQRWRRYVSLITEREVLR